MACLYLFRASEVKEMAITVITIQSMLALAFLLTGVTKVMGAKMQVENFEKWRYPQWFRVVTGLVEVVGAIGLIIGIWFPMVAVSAAILLVATMIGAVYTDLFRGDRPKAVAPAILLGMAVVVAVLGGIDVSA